MNTNDHLLVCLAEECAEVSQRVSKALRFGVSEIQPGQTLSNAERLTVELNDLFAVVELLMAEGVIVGIDRDAIAAKKAKLGAFMDYAVTCGTLEK